ncbi:MAG TPA: hypothetical protein VNZ52_08020, partial [Candidatus Thermoplasmatota archaeon]|nr:hypothetical protein [Candidatus Thermoplasmatota archaeon]
MRLGGYSTYSRIVPLVAVATLLLPLVPVIPVTAAGDELACALAPNDAGTGQDAAATELLGTPLALSVGVLETTGCFHRGDADDWFRVTSTPGAGHNLLVEVTGPTHNATPQILISDCMGKTLVAGHYWDERTVRAGMSFTPEYPALCVDVAPWVDVAYSAPFVVTAFGTQVPYELRFTLTKAACVDDDGGSGRDSDWVRPVDLAIDVYGAGATFTGCFPGEDWSNDFQAYDRWDDHYRFHAEAGRPFHVEVRSLSCQTSHSITLYAPETTTQGWPNSNYGSLY